ncbi:hypothetical protein G6F46_007974 [Rhizopus delemar]|nr:hypothetical protein G6F51_008812 [Rhizopus arrhizus]KAG1550487.1 hypothetical protein G6F49_009282 [Rhizopus delemar]KAG1567249.1 hypothetical protein G6F50_008384 [Rhizopus delemar]KAG1613097.1 hypothetical protein G6F46_007974 [Rhizopus delemar]KAG1627693.1 hypothetical protein G6F45_007463 [Rhizopus arrhizus]
MHLINFFDENPSAVIQDAVENLTKSFEGLEIKKSRVAEFRKEDCNLSIKVVTRHPKERNSQKALEARANWIEEWQNKVIGAVTALGVVNRYFMDEFPNMKGFHVVMDNAPIHSRDVVDPIISERGYIPVYLPPYSPELNPIESAEGSS